MLMSNRVAQALQHEIRTPLTAIFGMIFRLKESCLTSTQRNYVNAILISANHLLNFANSLEPQTFVSKSISEKKPKVLLVEDDLLIQYLHHDLLSELGYEVDVAKNAAEALALARNFYDLILLDIGLPDLNGIEVAKKIRLYPNHINTPVFAVTAYVDSETEKDCLEAGITRVIHKPVEQSTLAETLNNCNLFGATSI